MTTLGPLAATPLPSPPAATDRLKANVEKLFNLMLPLLAYMVPWEYRVIAATPSVTPPLVTLDLVAVDPLRCPVPQLNAIALWPGPSGAVAVPAPGTIALVRFADGSPAKPRVCGLDAAGTVVTVEEYAATLVRLGDATALPLVKSAALAALIASASAAAESAAVPGDGGKQAFTTFASSFAAGVAAITTTKVTGT